MVEHQLMYLIRDRNELDGRAMQRLAVNLIILLALAACTSAPAPEQPAKAEWLPCGGHGFHKDTRSYGRCIRHVATLAEEQPRGGATE